MRSNIERMITISNSLLDDLSNTDEIGVPQLEKIYSGMETISGLLGGVLDKQYGLNMAQLEELNRLNKSIGIKFSRKSRKIKFGKAKIMKAAIYRANEHIDASLQKAAGEVKRPTTNSGTNATSAPDERVRQMCIDIAMIQGGAVMYTSVSSRLNGHGGWQSLADDERFMGVPSLDIYKMVHRVVDLTADAAARRKLQAELVAHGRSEFVGFYRQQTDKRKVMHGEVVKVDDEPWEEPLVWMVYKAEEVGRHGLAWSDASGRPGQQLEVSIAITERSAKVLQDTLQKDPALIREIVEKVVKERILKKHPEYWNDVSGNERLRPPYESWDRAPGGGRIYVQPLDAPSEWKDDYDRAILK